jgi:hypothetical protein
MGVVQQQGISYHVDVAQSLNGAQPVADVICHLGLGPSLVLKVGHLTPYLDLV